MFEKKPIKKRAYTKSSTPQKRTLKRKYTRKKLSKFKKQPGKYIFKIFIYLFFLFIVFGFIASIVLYNKYLKDLPPVSELQNYEFAEASTIYDRNGEELYKFFEEKRTYIDYEQININMVNALVSGEDQRFWDNPGVDFIGLTRAGINGVLGKKTGFAGTSTLTQQLIRNTIIENRSSDETLEEKISRKIKEIYLAIKITKKLDKKKIIELYLNKIEFGSNAFGIEQASKTFFNKSAKDLNILESSMLASLPKTPTGLSPYNYPDRLIGYPYTFKENSEDEKINIISEVQKNENIESVNILADFIKNIKGKRLAESDKILLCGLDDKDFKNNVRIDSQGCSTQEYSKLLHFLNSIQLKNNDQIVEYQTGRKDFILGRMLEDDYITFDEYKQSIIDGFGYKFNKYQENIKAPHFVFYVKEQLEDIYGPELISKGGLKIYTSLDYKLQLKAEEIVKNQAESNSAKYNANNASVLTIDNKTGEVIVMVGSKDYFNEKINGNVNISTSLLQPGSTFKPFVYSIATQKNAIGSKTPVYDLETQFPGYKPQNFDGRFRGKMDFSTALNESRNIPAVKMFYMAGGEASVVNFMESLGVESLKNHNQYGAPLSLGTGEMTPIELARAYGVFANNGELKELNTVLKIEDSFGNEIYNSEKLEKVGKKVLPEGQTYLLNSVLSDTSTRPEFWNNYLSLSNRVVAAKTGTSTKQYVERGNKIIYPANLWTVGYTPQYTTVAWSGNTNGDKLNFKGNGLEGAGPIFKKVMEEVHKGKKVEYWQKPADVKSVKISSVSGLLPSEQTNSKFITESLFLNSPTAYDYSFQKVQVDALCNGKVTNKTPDAAIKTLNVVQFNSLNPKNSSWQNPVLAWAKSEKASQMYGNVGNFVTSVNENECERDGLPSKISVSNSISNNELFNTGLNNVTINYQSANPVIRIDILLNGKVLHKFDINNSYRGTYNGVIDIPNEFENTRGELTTRIVDIYYYSQDLKDSIYISDKDDINPEINITNPDDNNITLYKGTSFNLRGNVFDRSPIRTINIYINDKRYKIGLEGPEFVVPIDSNDLDEGIHTIRVEAIDYSFNKSYENVRLRVLEK